MKKVAIVGQIEIETNDSGEVFLTHGKTKLRISDVSGGLMVTFAGNGGSFIPHNINGLPAMIFRGFEYLLGTYR